jgi:hypothetical protein
LICKKALEPTAMLKLADRSRNRVRLLEGKVSRAKAEVATPMSFQ